MKKQVLSLMTVIVLTFCVFMTASAEEDVGNTPVRPHEGTAAELKSYGAIVYQNGPDTIKIDSNDLYTLADQIDQVKLEVANQLEAMNTYFTSGEGISLTTSTDVNVVHAEPYEEDFINPLDVNFDTLLEGIAVSQSVSVDVTAYGYPAGTKLYKKENGLLTTNGAEGAEEISVTAASADNLSAGTAAWVNGNLILGTGTDNCNYSNTNKIVIVPSNQIKNNSYQFEHDADDVYIFTADRDDGTGIYNACLNNNKVNYTESVKCGWGSDTVRMRRFGPVKERDLLTYSTNTKWGFFLMYVY